MSYSFRTSRSVKTSYARAIFCRQKNKRVAKSEVRHWRSIDNRGESSYICQSTTHHKAFFCVLVLGFIGVPSPGKLPVSLGDFFGFGCSEVFKIKSQNTVTIILPTKDVLGIIIMPPIRMFFGVKRGCWRLLLLFLLCFLLLSSSLVGVHGLFFGTGSRQDSRRGCQQDQQCCPS